MTTTRTHETRKQRRPYRPPVIRSEKILVANLFASKDPGQGCGPNCLAPDDPTYVD